MWQVMSALILQPYMEINSHTPQWWMGGLVSWSLRYINIHTSNHMSLKSKRKSIGKGGRKGKGKADGEGQKGAGSLGQDAGGSGSGERSTGTMDKYIEEFYDLEEKARKALIGYSQTDIIHRNLEFGIYNKRELNHQEKRALLDSFNHNGLDRFGITQAIPLIVRRSDIVEGSVRQLTAFDKLERDGSHLPELKLAGNEADEDEDEDVKDLPKIVAAGGRHRRHALVDWLKQKKGQMVVAQRTLSDLKSKTVLQDDEATEGQIAEAEDMLKHAKGLVDMRGSWVVAIYDKGVSYF